MKHAPGILASIKKYRLNSIFVKNFLLIMLIILLPLTIISGIIYRYFNGIIEDEIKTIGQSSLVKVKDTTDMIVRQCLNIGLKIVTDTSFSLYLLPSVQYTAKNDLTKTLDEDIVDMIKMYTMTSDYIDSIYIYSERKDYVLSNRSPAAYSFFYDNTWKREYDSYKNEKGFWMSVRKVQVSTSSNEYNYLSLFRVSDNKDGLIIINIDLNKLGKIVNDNAVNSFEDIYIIDDQGKIVFNRNVQRIGAYFEKIVEEDAIQPEKNAGSLMADNSDAKRFVSQIASEMNGWKYISYLSLKNYNVKTSELNHFITLFIILCIIFAFIIAFLISIKTFGPIKDIISAMEKPEMWTNGRKTGYPAMYDEVKYIAGNIVDNYHTVHQLKLNLEKRITLAKQAQTVALQSQINPHFLYNTLETINWMALEFAGGKNLVSNMILSLSKLLRMSLDSDNSMVTVNDEIQYARIYLDIQKHRYGNKFITTWNIDENILNCKVVKISLQPLIENSIYHGIKPKVGSGTIHIKGYRLNEDIVIEVKDNGIGIPAVIVENLNQGFENEFMFLDSHIGLKNVNQRIKLIMGERFGLTVYSNPDETTVKMHLPLII